MNVLIAGSIIAILLLLIVAILSIVGFLLASLGVAVMRLRQPR